MQKLIMVLLDGCRYDAITEYAGFMEHLVDLNRGAKYKVRGELPSFSRAMYATLMTGLPTAEHGITSNRIQERCNFENIFSLCKQHGKTSAAAAYWWMSQLYNESMFDFAGDRFRVNRPADAINYGIYYWEDLYPDSHLIMDGEYLRTAYDPDFLLIHSMNIDLMGHQHGSDSNQYADAVAEVTEVVGRMIPVWTKAGYNVTVTADHGMDHRGIHGGTTDGQRDVALYLFGENFLPGRFEQTEISQLNIAPAICRVLGISPSASMLQPTDISFIHKTT